MADSIQQAAELQIARHEDEILDLESELSIYTHTDDLEQEKRCLSALVKLENKIESLRELL